MKNKCVNTPLVLTASILLGLLFLHVGCEDSPSDEGATTYFDNSPYQSESRESPSSQGTAPTLTISPGAVLAAPGQLINFTASGGVSPFAWAVGTLANGNVVEQGNERYAIYTHLGTTNDANNVIVTDGTGATAIGTIN